MKNPTSFIALFILMIGSESCTNVSFTKAYDGPRGVDFKKGTVVLNDLTSPYSRDETLKLTAIALENLHKMTASVTSIQSVQSSISPGITLPKDITSGLIDSLKKYTPHYYLMNIALVPEAASSSGVSINQNEFEDNRESEAYFNNRVTVQITVFDIQANKQIYMQTVTASEMVDSEDSLNDDPPDILFTRSNENIAKNALVSGLRDLKRHSKKM